MLLGLPVIFLIACIFAAFRESKVTAIYKTLNIYTRLSAYLALDFTMAGLFLYIASAFLPLFSDTSVNALSSFPGIIGGALLFGAGLVLYVRAYRRCPDSLKKKLIPSMIITGLGVSMKICLFFLPSIWHLTTGQETIYVPHKMRHTSTGELFTLIGAYGSYALYKDESGVQHILEKFEQTGDLFATELGTFRTEEA